MDSGDSNAIYIFREILYNPVKLAIVVGAILFAFDKMYKLLSVALHSPASQVGAGFGGIIGLFIGIVCYGSWSAVAFGLGAGALLGGVSINGIIELEHNTQQAIERKQKAIEEKRQTERIIQQRENERIIEEARRLQQSRYREPYSYKFI